MKFLLVLKSSKELVVEGFQNANLVAIYQTLKRTGGDTLSFLDGIVAVSEIALLMRVSQSESKGSDSIETGGEINVPYINP